MSLFVFAGEHSGDLHGEALLRALRRSEQTLRVFGVGGPGMRAQGLELVMPMEQFQVFGFIDVAAKLPKIMRQFWRIRDLILKEQPTAVLLIDYPGFNLRLARALRKRGYQGKIIYYICPTVWATHKGRIEQLAEAADLLLTIFPFEPPLFKHTSLPVKFVGHPLVEATRGYQYDDDWLVRCGIPRPVRSLALFPGSREGEIKRLLPRQLAAALKLRQIHLDTAILISCADPQLRKTIESEIRRLGQDSGKEIYLVPRQYTYELMRECHLALSKSGTVTLELALHSKPSVVVYDVSKMDRLIARYVLRLNLPHYCIVNILCGRTVFPEFIDAHFTANDLVDALEKFFSDGPDRQRCLEDCHNVFEALQTPFGGSAAENAAQAIQGLL